MSDSTPEAQAKRAAVEILVHKAVAQLADTVAAGVGDGLINEGTGAVADRLVVMLAVKHSIDNTVKWCMKQLGIESTYERADRVARSVANSSADRANAALASGELAKDPS